MPKISFTETAVARLPSAESGTIWYSDTRTEGFLLAVGKRKKTFYITKSLRNRQIRMKIGEHPLLPVEGARKRAGQLLSEISQGNDPRYGANDAEQESVTVQQALDRYIAKRTTERKKRKKQITDGTAQNYRDLFRCHAKRLMSREIRSITQEEVVALHDRLERYPSAANKLVRVLRSLQRDVGMLLPPFDDYYVEERKENNVKPADRTAFGKQVLAIENVCRRAAWLLGLYTGIRKNTLLALEWDHIDFKERTVFIAKMKNRHARTLPLSRQAIAVLRDLVGLDAKWVLPSFDGSKSGHLIEVRDETMAATACFHDTRRIFSECAGECLLPEYAIAYLRGDVVNKSMSQRYMSHLDHALMREPRQRIADHIERELFPKPKTKKKRTTARIATARSEVRIAA